MWVQKVSGGGVDSLAYAPDGRTLYTLTGGRGVTAWDVATRTGTSVVTAADCSLERIGQFRVAGGGQYLILVSSENWFVWGCQTRSVVAALRPSPLFYIAGFDPEGTTCVRVGSGGAERWDFVTQQPVAQIGRWQLSEPLRYVELAPDLRRAALVTLKGAVYLADLADTQPPAKLTLPEPVHNIGVRFSPDGGTLAVLYHRLMYLWDVPSLKVRAKARWADPNPDWKLSFHPTARLFAALNKDKAFTLYSLDTGDPVRALDFALGRSVHCACFAPDGLTCAVGGSNKQFAVFDVDL
jgi:WD40 repeat protein